MSEVEYQRRSLSAGARMARARGDEEAECEYARQFFKIAIDHELGVPAWVVKHLVHDSAPKMVERSLKDR